MLHSIWIPHLFTFGVHKRSNRT